MPANDNSFFTPQRMMKIGVALCFDFVKFVFSILFIFAPLIACVASAAAVSSYFGAGSWVQGAACAVGGFLAGAFEFATGGLGAAAIQAVGEVLADAIDFAAWVFFSLWFLVSGVKFIGGGKRGTTSFFCGMASSVLGALPFANIAPTITMGVVAIEWNQWKADKEKAAANDNREPSRTQRLEAQRERLQDLQDYRSRAEELGDRRREAEAARAEAEVEAEAEAETKAAAAAAKTAASRTVGVLGEAEGVVGEAAEIAMVA